MDGIYWTRACRARVVAGYRALLAASPVPLQELTVSTRSGDTAVFTCGSVHAPPLVALHGGNSNSAMWLPSLQTWSATHRVYAVDIVGDPGLSASIRLAFDFDAHAQWFSDVLAALKLGRVSIVGASFGGWVALDFATRYPQAVDRLILFAPAGVVPMSRVAKLEIGFLMLLGSWGRHRALLRSFGMPDSQLSIFQRRFLEFCAVVQVNALSRIRLPRPMPDQQLQLCAARTLAVLGGKDLFFDAEEMAARLRNIGSLVSVQLNPGAGHASVDPTLLVQEFLARTGIVSGP